MPGTPKHPVTVGDLRVWIEGEDFDPHMGGRPATLADLVSALRAEGAVERMLPVLLGWDDSQNIDVLTVYANELLDALAVAQP